MGEYGGGPELHFVGSEFCGSGSCVEVARLPDDRVVLRSTLAPDGPSCLVTATEWSGFLDAMKNGLFDDV